MSEPEAKAAETDIEEEQLNQAIEDLRGALHDELAPAGARLSALYRNLAPRRWITDCQSGLSSKAGCSE